ncbi:four helix bundle protein [Petrimonas sp.]|jgi:DNA polymerase II small subunit/DNA polymerase delta subunit B|uniref:four helix bundle protein n=1 Tax=Petrimonas sp. TaxID=2023866 RepID=UPI002FCB534B
MKLSSSTKIYIDCRSLLDEILNITVDFPKAYKFTIGTKMQEYSVEALNDISGAYINKSLKVRIDYLTSFQTKFETLKTLIRIASERKWISIKKFAAISALTTSIGRQSTAWKNSLISAERRESEGHG